MFSGTVDDDVTHASSTRSPSLQWLAVTSLSCLTPLKRHAFSDASGRQLNMTKYEILPMNDFSEQSMVNIPVKECIIYLGIYI